MAKGLFQNVRYKGTVGGVTYRVVNGEYIASNKSSLSKETVQNSPAFENTRKLNSEFRGVAYFSKALQNEFLRIISSRPGNKSAAKTYLYPEIVKLAREGMSKSTAQVFGERSILSSNLVGVFDNFQPTKERFEDYASLNYEIQDAEPEGNGQKNLLVSPFGPANAFRAPEGATGYMLLGIGVYVPNYVFNANTQKYEPVSNNVDYPVAIGSAGVISAGDLSQTTTVQPEAQYIDPISWEDGTVGLYMVGIGVVFTKTVGSQVIGLREGLTAKIIKTYSWQ